MTLSNSIMWVSAKPSFSSSFLQNPKPLLPQISCPSLHSQSSLTPTIHCGLRELRVRIDSIKSTQKITEAMKLVAAARVRRAQEAVINGRPFAETLAEVLYDINERLQGEAIDVPLTNVRPVKKVALVVITSDRGLCGGFNNLVIKKTQTRIAELKKLGLDVTVISVGKKGNFYFKRRPEISVDRFIEGGLFATTKEAQAIADDVFSLFISEEVDKVELMYSKFVSLVKSQPVIQTLLPLSPRGEVVDGNGNCVDAMEDEFFRLTTKGGKLSVERDSVKKKREGLSPVMEFEQDPVQIIDAMMPLYLNSQILRALQESTASELAARMNAMSNATDNADDLKKTLSNSYNRERQAKITGEILEIVAGAEALKDFDQTSWGPKVNTWETINLEIYKRQIPLWNLGKVVVPGSSQSEKGRQSPMENRYGLTTQGSGVWRALRDGDFEEEDVWEVLKDRNSSSNKMIGRSKESSVSVPRHLPTASRMIPKASSHNYGSGSSCSSSNTITHEAKIVQQSAPVNIPDWSEVYGQKSKKAPKNVSWQNDDDDDEEEVGDDDGDSDDDDEEEEDYDSKVPPHEFIARRLARSQISSFSVVEGAGRTLKGRDLSKVRNAVLTKTGFLESL